MSQSFPRRIAAACAGAAGFLMLYAAPASAQLRVATWNISNYNDTTLAGRTVALQRAIYNTFDGRSMAPDVILGQEFQSQSAVTNFVNVLNTAPNSPGDWAAGAYGFSDGVADSDSAFFYRTSKVNFSQTVVVAFGSSSSSNQPRDTKRYDVSLKGYAGAAPALSLYSVHMKSGSSGEDQARRLVEAQRIRDDAQALPAGRQFLVAGDMNVQSSSQSAYVEYVGSQANNAGRFVDPINTPGSWNNTAAYRFVHTQDPVGAGGMDDRHDQILLGTGLVDGAGFDYIGNPNVAYSTTTWNDPNHSYRAWGNDGTSYGAGLTVTGNAMVGPTIAQALRDAAADGGHLPVFLDLRAPAELAKSIATINFGDVDLGDLESRAFNIFNGVDASIWDAGGVETLAYTMSATGAFAVPGGTFTDAAGGGVNGHLVSLDTSTLGLKTGAIQLFVGDQSAGSISLQANVVPEPAALALLALATFGVTGRRRRRA